MSSTVYMDHTTAKTLDHITAKTSFQAREQEDPQATDNTSRHTQETVDPNTHLSEHYTNTMPLETPKPNSLLDLPAEIWKKIGEEAVVSNCCPDCDNKFHDLPVQPAITRVCKIMRAELLPYFYSRVELCLSRDFNGYPIPHSVYMLWDRCWDARGGFDPCGRTSGHILGPQLDCRLQQIGPFNRRAIGHLRVVTTENVGDLPTEKAVIRKLQGEWMVDFELGKCEGYCDRPWVEIGLQSYRVTFL